MIFTANLLFNVFGVIIALLIAIIVYYKRQYAHWKNLGVPYIEPIIPIGNILNSLILHKMSIGEELCEMYNYFKSKNAAFGGAFMLSRPMLVPVDLDLLKRIMQTDFAHFTDHGGYINERDDPLASHLFTLGGEKWRNLRVKLTPTFTSGKMKMMFPIIIQISEELIKVIEIESKAEGIIEAKDLLARFGTDVIGNCAFGIECNSLKDPNAEFRVQGRRLNKLTKLEQITLFVTVTTPNLARFLRLRQIPKEAGEFFWNAVKETVEYREQNNVRRNDFLQLLIDMKRKDGVEDENGLTFAEIAAQAFVFFMGGFETSSTVTSFALVELGLNEEIQNKLRDEVSKSLEEHNGEITYEGIIGMKYMDMVVNETLRKYPPLPVLPRTCTKDYRIPDTQVIIKAGDAAFIPILAIHRDPEYFPDPEKFDPNRFNEENKSKRHQYAYIPFGEGPRICIGLRFGMMQVKVALAAILRNYRVKVNPQTTIPIKFDPGNFITAAPGGLWLDLEKI